MCFVLLFQVDLIRLLREVENPVAMRNEPKLVVELALDRIQHQADRSRRNLARALLLLLVRPLREEQTSLCLVVAFPIWRSRKRTCLRQARKNGTHLDLKFDLINHIFIVKWLFFFFKEVDQTRLLAVTHRRAPNRTPATTTMTMTRAEAARVEATRPRACPNPTPSRTRTRTSERLSRSQLNQS